MENLLLIVLFVIAVSSLLNIALQRLDIPPLVGYIFAGAIASAQFKLVGDDSEALGYVAEFGIAFLMFTIGLEFSIRHLVSMKKEVFVLGPLQVLLTTVIFSLLGGFFFGMPQRSALVLGSGLALSSTAIVLTILNRSGDIRRRYGRNAFGILLFQDLAVVPILIMITLFANAEAKIGALLFQTALSGFLLLVILYFLGKYGVSIFLTQANLTKSDEIFINSILLIVIGASFLAHTLGFSYSLGAFIAGMLIAETKFKHKVEADLVPFRDLLLGVFFVTVGMQIDIKYAISHLHLALILTVAIMLIKGLLLFLVNTFGNFPKTSLKTAIALSQVGEFSFAVFSLAKSNGLLDADVTQLMVLAVIISMIATPFILKNVKTIAGAIVKGEEIQTELIQPSAIRNHFIVLGYGTQGKKIVQELKKRDFPYIAIDNNIDNVRYGIRHGDAVVLGNAAQKRFLKQFNIEAAAATIVAIDNEKKLNLVCSALLEINPNMNIIVRVNEEEQKSILKDMGIKHIIDDKEEMAARMVDLASRCELS